VPSVLSFAFRESARVCTDSLRVYCLLAVFCMVNACHGSADPDCARTCRAGEKCAALCGKVDPVDAGTWRPPAAPKSETMPVSVSSDTREMSEIEDDAGPVTKFARDAQVDAAAAPVMTHCLDGKSSSRELCNAIDDDCDGTIDEDTTVTCYPDGTPGCSAANGGKCAGICLRGEQRCSGGALGACTGATIPKPEGDSCNGLDDDCNGVVDDGFDLQNDAQHCGHCDQACTTGNLCCGGQCVDPTQKEHCGGCGPAFACAAGMACCKGSCAPADAMGACPMPPPTSSACDSCALGQECCGDHCVNIRGTDVDHCGACGTTCTKGKLPGCCGGACVDLLTDTTCGSCDNACGLLKLGGGFLCHCESSEAGPSCVGGEVGQALQVCH
jgi:hypothetical protein